MKRLLLVLLALGGAWALVSANFNWVTVQFDTLTVELPGSALLPLLNAIGGVQLGAVAALLLLRGWGRPVVAGIAALASATLAIQMLTQLAGDWASSDWIAERALEHGGVQVTGVTVTNIDWSSWPSVTIAIALISTAVAVLTTLLSPRWPVATRRFDREVVTDDAAGQWDALSHGDDPTATVRENPPTAG